MKSDQTVKNEFEARPLSSVIKARIIQFIDDHITLGQALLVAMSLHVVLFPSMWIIGWALPWPKPPVFTTIIEYDLRGWTGWPKMPRAKKVFDIMDPDLNK